nr:reverse transcriptase domain-containing protein [Tanacetum cinerariifolium]
MVAYLTKSDAGEGFNQVIDFLNGSYLKYALTVNPDIYVSCIKQFWNTVAIKQVNDVTRLQALVEKKKVVVTEAAIREVLRLDDAEGVDCLPNEEIFIELARMGYEKPSTKLTFYKAFFSSQWKFLIHTILLSLGAKRTSWNEFSSAMASVVICLSIIFLSDLSTHTTKYTSPTLTQKVFANMRRVGKGFFRVETPLFEGMLTGQEIEEEGDADEHVEDVTASDDAQGDDTAAHGEVPTVTQEPSIPFSMALDIIKLKKKVKKLEKGNKVRVLKLIRLQKVGTSHRVDTSDDTVMDDESNQGRMIDEIDKDDDVVLMDEKEEDKKVEEDKVDESAQVQGRQAESQAEIYKIDMDHALKVLSMQEDEPTKVQEVVDVVTTAKLIIKVVTAASEIVTAASAIIYAAEPQVPAATITDAPTKVAAAPSRRRKGVDPYVQIYQVMKRKPQTEAQARKNMMMYLKNVTGFKLDYFKVMSYDDIRIKVAKRRKLNKEVEDLKRHREIVPDEDDDVYTEATPLVRKNFNREDLEALWSLVKERCTGSSLEKSKDYTWSSKGQELEATGIICDFLLEEVDAFLALEDDSTSLEVDQSYVDTEGDILLLKAFFSDDPSLPPPNQGNYLPQVQKELKICEVKIDKSSIDEPPEVELKDLSPHLEYTFLEGDDKLPVIIAKDLSVEEKTALITVLKSHKRAIAWKLSDIKEVYDGYLSRHDQKTMEVFMDDFSVFGNSFQTCLSHLEKMLKRCEDTNLCLNWEKSHFLVKESIVLGHKISKDGIEVDKAKLSTTCRNGLKRKRSPPTTLELFENSLSLSLPDLQPPVPSSVIKVEVSNRGLKRILKRTMDENRASWLDKLDDALWALRTAYKTPIECTPYKLVYRKACHLLIELEHKAYWALKHANSYENSPIYKDKTKRLHDSKIKDHVFNIGDRVLLFNSRLNIFSGKLKTRWSGPFTITHVFPYGTLELSQTDGPNFKVNGYRLKHYFGVDIPKLVVPDLQTFLKDQ